MGTARRQGLWQQATTAQDESCSFPGRSAQVIALLEAERSGRYSRIFWLREARVNSSSTRPTALRQ